VCEGGKIMGMFERFGKWIDRGIVRFIGKPAQKIGEKITGVGERIEKRFAPEIIVKKTWREKAMDAIDEEEEPELTDDEIREKYDTNGV
jgi:hypothetical protein